jgi:hypothetical protein
MSAYHESGPDLAEEIRLLVELVIRHAAPWLEGVVSAGHGAADGQAGAAADPDDAGHDGAPGTGHGGCEWCPLCAVIAVARGERPEFAAGLLEQAAHLIALLRAVLADRWEPDGTVHMPGFRPRSEPHDPADERTAPRVQHVTVRRGSDWQPAGER